MIRDKRNNLWICQKGSARNSKITNYAHHTNSREMFLPQIIVLLILPLHQHLAKPVTFHGSPIKTDLVQLLHPLIIHQSLLICLELLVLFALAVDPIIQPGWGAGWAFGIGPNNDITFQHGVVCMSIYQQCKHNKH